jgi:hypothetical protein
MTNPTKSNKSGSLLQLGKVTPVLEPKRNSLTPNNKPKTRRIVPANIKADALARKGGVS